MNLKIEIDLSWTNLHGNLHKNLSTNIKRQISVQLPPSIIEGHCFQNLFSDNFTSVLIDELGLALLFIIDIKSVASS